MMTFKEHAELDELLINPVTIKIAGAIVVRSAVKIGKEIVKLAAPPLSINSAIKGTVIYTIAKKYELDTIIEIQKYGVGLIVDVAEWMGLGITPADAAKIFGRLVAGGAITLGAILLSLIAYKNPKKARQIYNKAKKLSTNAKKKLTNIDVSKIRKQLRAA